jgi:uncharacterized membrane protein
MIQSPRLPVLALCSAMTLALGACGSGKDDPKPGPKPGDVAVYNGIGEDEAITALGNEPFWSARIEGAQLTYSTPDNIEGTAIAVTRFAGNGGLGISGTLDGAPLQLAITPGKCSDGMSDRSYPFTATLAISDTVLRGCAYTDGQPFSGEENP